MILPSPCHRLPAGIFGAEKFLPIHSSSNDNQPKAVGRAPQYRALLPIIWTSIGYQNFSWHFSNLGCKFELVVSGKTRPGSSIQPCLGIQRGVKERPTNNRYALSGVYPNPQGRILVAFIQVTQRLKRKGYLPVKQNDLIRSHTCMTFIK